MTRIASLMNTNADSHPSDRHCADGSSPPPLSKDSYQPADLEGERVSPLSSMPASMLDGAAMNPITLIAEEASFMMQPLRINEEKLTDVAQAGTGITPLPRFESIRAQLAVLQANTAIVHGTAPKPLSLLSSLNCSVSTTGDGSTRSRDTSARDQSGASADAAALGEPTGRPRSTCSERIECTVDVCMGCVIISLCANAEVEVLELRRLAQLQATVQPLVSHDRELNNTERRMEWLMQSAVVDPLRKLSEQYALTKPVQKQTLTKLQEIESRKMEIKQVLHMARAQDSGSTSTTVSAVKRQTPSSDSPPGLQASGAKSDVINRTTGTSMSDRAAAAAAAAFPESAPAPLPYRDHSAESESSSSSSSSSSSAAAAAASDKAEGPASTLRSTDAACPAPSSAAPQDAIPALAANASDEHDRTQSDQEFAQLSNAHLSHLLSLTRGLLRMNRKQKHNINQLLQNFTALARAFTGTSPNGSGGLSSGTLPPLDGYDEVIPPSAVSEPVSDGKMQAQRAHQNRDIDRRHDDHQQQQPHASVMNAAAVTDPALNSVLSEMFHLLQHSPLHLFTALRSLNDDEIDHAAAEYRLLLEQRAHGRSDYAYGSIMLLVMLTLCDALCSHESSICARWWRYSQDD